MSFLNSCCCPEDIAAISGSLPHAYGVVAYAWQEGKKYAITLCEGTVAISVQPYRYPQF